MPTAKGGRGAFASAFLVQATYSGLALTPFIIKEVNPFNAWPQP